MRIFKDWGKAVKALNYIFCSDEYLLVMNQDYLHHDTFTDIITFDLSDSGSEVVADIFISVDRVRENASSLGIPFRTELSRVIIHGALHLVGYGDKTSQAKASMRDAEEKYLKLLPSVPRETKAKKKFHVKLGKRVS